MSKIAGYIFSILLFAASAGSYGQNVIKGQADLSNHNFAKQGAVPLSGEWEFYWNKLLTPSDFATNQKPEWFWSYAWNRQSDYPAIGFATYRLRLKLPERQRGLSIFIMSINTAGKIWLNDELVSESGKVSANKAGHVPRLGNLIVSIPENVHEVELVVQISNWTYFGGGFAYIPRVDTS